MCSMDLGIGKRPIFCDFDGKCYFCREIAFANSVQNFDFAALPPKFDSIVGHKYVIPKFRSKFG